MLDQLINELPADIVDSFLKRAKIIKPSEHDIAQKSDIITKEAGSALSKSIAGVHTAFNSINTSVVTGNKIEKAKMIRAEQVAKENMMETKPGSASAINVSSLFKFPVDKLVKNFQTTDNLFNELADVLQQLDLSCNICEIPCEDDFDFKKKRRRGRTGSRTKVPSQIPSDISTSRSLPAPSVEVPRSLPAPRSTIPTAAPRGLPYQPLPEPLDVKSPRQPQLVEVSKSQAPKTVAQEFYEGKYSAQEAKEAFKAQRQAAKTSAPSPTSKPSGRWTGDIPKEQYFDRIRANEAQRGFEQAAKATPQPKSGITSQAANTGGKVLKYGGRALGAAGVGLDIYDRTTSGQSVGKTAIGVGSGLAGSSAGASAGAAIGAAVGSVVPVAGTAAGGIAGGLIGGALGYFGGSYVGDKAYDTLAGAKQKPIAQKVQQTKTAPQSQQAIKQLNSATKQVQSQAKKVTDSRKENSPSSVAFSNRNAEFTDFIGKTMKSVSDTISSLITQLKDAIANAASSAGGALSSIGSSIGETVDDISTSIAAGGGDSWVMGMIKKHEGVRNKPYKDSRGLWTVGVGHLIGDGRTLPPDWNRTFSDQEIDQLFQKDFAHHKAAAEKIPGYSKANAVGKGAIIDLTFNMGPAWYKKFPSTTAAMAKGDWAGAAAGLQNSLWYRQVGDRAKTIVGMISKAGSAMSTAVSGASSAIQGAATAVGKYASQALKGLGGSTPVGLNGNLPASMLTPIGVGNHRLQPAAANAFKAMSAAAKAAGIPLPITDSYRTYDAQVRLKREKGNMAATPGRSNHGWGLALDISTGGDKSKIFNWLVNNASRFGWRGPLSKPYEPWHWEFAGTGTSKPMAAPNTKAATTPPSPPATGGVRPTQPGKQVVPGKSALGGTRTVVLEKQSTTTPKNSNSVAIGAKGAGNKTNRNNSSSYLAYFGIG